MSTEYNFSSYTESNKKSLAILISDDSDYQEFCKIEKVAKDQGHAVRLFREIKINSSSISFEEFENSFEKDPVLAIQSLFMHPVTQAEINFLEQRVSEGDFTLEELYNKHVKRPYLPLYRFIL